MEDDVFSSVIELCGLYKDLEWSYLTPTCIEVLRSNFVIAPDPCRPLRPVRLLASKEKVILEVLFHPLRELSNPVDVKALDDIVKSMSSYGQYVFCPGLSDDDLNDLTKSKATNAVRTDVPYKRTSAKDCLMYFGQKKRQSNFQPVKLCPKCCTYRRRVHAYDSKKAKTPERVKKIHAQLNSSTPFSKLTPTSRRIRSHRGRRIRWQQKRKIERLEAKLKKHDIKLKSSQHAEMKSIHGIISESFSDDLDNELASYGNDATTKEMRMAWDRDRRAKHAKDKGDFFKDQAKSKTGSKGNRWSLITYRLALAIFLRSKAAYEALKSFQILQLPSTDTLRTFMQQRLSQPGLEASTLTYLKDQMIRYDAINNEKIGKGEKSTSGHGIIVFDEVKVVDKVVWNSKNHELVGLSMTEDDYSSLHDVYNLMKNCKKNLPTNYVLQFLWRDLQQSYDVIGPWFTFSQPIEAKQLLPCVMDTVRAFHAFEFKCLALVCDGASSNLALIKRTTSSLGIYPSSDLTADGSATVDPSFENPCDFRIRIHWIICPSHQLKNMINALHSSRTNGSKDFHISGVPFGWKAIQDLYSREVKRAENNESRMVPKLQKSHVVRDSWTKLNVKPARIMIQEHVICELNHHIHPVSGRKPQDVKNVKAVLDYLKAVQQIFDLGLLSKTRLERGDGPAIINIKEGLKYFYNWLKGLTDADKDFKPSDAKQKLFISWQTWDLLRIAAYGFIGLQREYASHCPGEYFYPVKVNGSSVETLFSQMKFSSAGKLSGANYTQARRNLLMKMDVHGPRASRGDYRRAPLAVANEPLKQARRKRASPQETSV